MPFRATRMATAIWLSAACAGVAAAYPSHAQQPGIPYEEVARLPLALKAKSSHIRIDYVVTPGKGYASLPDDLRVEIAVAGKHVPVAMAADGALNLPLREDWVAADARLVSNQPPGRTGLSMRWNYQWVLSPIGAKQLDAHRLRQVGDEFDSVLANSPAAMKLSAWVMVFEAPGTELRIVPRDFRAETRRADAEGRLLLPVEAIPGIGRLEFGSSLRSLAPLPMPLPASRG